MAQYLDKKVPISNAQIRMNWSACVKGCGIHEIADIGFEGCKTKYNAQTQGGVHITIGGEIGIQGGNGYSVIRGAPLTLAHLYVESLLLEYKKLRVSNESFQDFQRRVLSHYSAAYIGFFMKLGAYTREKNIDLGVDINCFEMTGKNEHFEIFEFGRKLYYSLTGQRAYKSHNNFTNSNQKSRLTTE